LTAALPGMGLIGRQSVGLGLQDFTGLQKQRADFVRRRRGPVAGRSLWYAGASATLPIESGRGFGLRDTASCLFGRKPPAVRRGAAPLSSSRKANARRQARNRLNAGRRKTVRERSSPDGRDLSRAARGTGPGEPASKNKRNRRVERGPTGTSC
jgi:hypothetical protein